MSVKFLHFADAHIDVVSGGKKDPKTAMPYHALDFLNALDRITDAAISEQTDLVLFAGDAYRDSTPGPTWQREWGKRLKRLSDAHIPTLIIGGNHDISHTVNRAPALQEVETYSVPYLHLAGSVKLWTPDELDGVPVQVLTVPWFTRSAFTAQWEKTRDAGSDLKDEDFLNWEIDQITVRIQRELDKADPGLPLILLAHYSVEGAKMSSRQSVGLGKEVTLPLGLLRDPRITYTALGHIHVFQDLNEGQQPPVVYSGSIEHVNYGEAGEKKGFILGTAEPGHADYRFVTLPSRPMFNIHIRPSEKESMQQELLDALPAEAEIKDAMVSLTVTYPREWETEIDEKELRTRMAGTLEFRIVRDPQNSNRIRIGDGDNIGSMTPVQLFGTYCRAKSVPDEDTAVLTALAKEIIGE